MARTVPFHYIDLRTFCYATEDESRVTAALQAFLPAETPIDRTVNTGHHGDRIAVLSTRLDTADDMRYVLDRIVALDEIDEVLDELDDRVDEDCSLFLSFDKQAAFRGTVALGRGILLRAKVEAYPAKKPAAIDNVREALAN